jgi:hypothetical protein
MKILGRFAGWQKVILLSLGILACASSLCLVAIGALTFFPKTSSNLPTTIPLPSYKINEVSDNGSTNVSYFLVADKTLAKSEAETIINYYKKKHIEQRGYQLINIYIFCDEKYAYNDALWDTTISDAEFFNHVLYWYQAGEWSDAGVIFMSGPNAEYPNFGSSCK